MAHYNISIVGTAIKKFILDISNILLINKTVFLHKITMKSQVEGH